MKKIYIFIILGGVTLILIFLIVFNQLMTIITGLKNNDEKNIKEIGVLNYQINEKDNLIEELTTRVEHQKNEIENLNQKITAIDEENENLKSTLSQMNEYIEAINKELVDERVNKVPDNYYTEKSYNYPNSIQGLSDYLNYGFQLPRSYELDIFDCSESSAYLEWCLEKEGFNTLICTGKAPFDQDSYHAWVIVTTDDGYRTAVEATVLTGGINLWIDRLESLFNNSARGVVYFSENDLVSKRYYYNYDNSYETIYDAVKATNISEWNWWEGAWGLN